MKSIMSFFYIRYIMIYDCVIFKILRVYDCYDFMSLILDFMI